MKQNNRKLSIIIPAYNEAETIEKVIDAVKKQKIPIEKEIIAVNDGSTDSTLEKLKTIKGIKIVSYGKNRGKGHAIKIGIRESKGEIVLIQDADLELTPEDYPELIKPIIEGKTAVVYGSRILGKREGSQIFIYNIGGRFITFIANILFGTKITDEPCGYKIFRKDIFESIRLESNGFDWEPEITAKIAKKGIKIHEVPVRYFPRTAKQGKKLRAKDGLIAAWTLIKYRFKN